MSRFHSYILSASKIIDTYDGAGPLTHHLKTFFSAQKKYGSRDRKTIASLCYGYFRTGHLLKNAAVDEKILAGLFLTENKSNEILELLKQEWNSCITLSVGEKLSMLNVNLSGIFPCQHELSDEIEKELFAISFLQQPDLFLRIRPGKENKVAAGLQDAAISFVAVNEHCLKFANNTSLENIIKINKDALIQDCNSQQVLNFLEKNPSYFSPGEQVEAWDSCAASGGKSILLYDTLKTKPRLTVSDIRENILANLTNRLQDAGININRKFIADLSKSSALPAEILFSLIICDAPCTGSGTWGRTPEQLFYFKEDMLATYAERQKKIVSNIIPHLKPGGLFFYITCSVFKKENEEVVEYIKEKFHLPLLQMEYLKGYDKKADTMFVAVFSA